MLKRVILLVLVLNVYVAVNTDTQSNLRAESGNSSCFKVDQVMDDVQPLAPVDPCEPLELYSDVIFDGICTANTPCARCIGDCDSHDDCEGDLQCFQRDGYQRVPGCLSFGPGDFLGNDYCYDPSCTADETQTCGPLPLQSDPVDDGVCTEATPCGQCQGECDNDSQCINEMICFQRSGFEPVPGCISGGVGDIEIYDYCVHPECQPAEAYVQALAVQQCKDDKVAPSITYKSVPGTAVAGGDAAQWEARFQLATPSPPGTCETTLTDLQALNNQNNCPGGTDSNYYFKYTVTFDLCEDQDMNWHVPVDAAWGGVSVMDGVEVARYDGDMWGNWMIDFQISLAAGVHTFELYAGEHCCSGLTYWKVNDRNLSLQEMMDW